jgi:hypothetical protein
VLLSEAHRALIELNEPQGVPTLGDNFYALCADGCIGLISNRLEDIGPTKRIHYVFEAGDKGLGHFRHTIEVIHRRSQQYRDEMRIASIKKLPKKAEIAVQTPDILAYVVTHQQIDPFVDDARPSYLQQLVGRVPVKVNYIDEDLVRKGSAGFTEEVSLELARSH